MIPSNNRHFTKIKGVLKLETKPTMNSSCKFKIIAPLNDSYDAHLYDPNDSSNRYHEQDINNLVHKRR